MSSIVAAVSAAAVVGAVRLAPEGTFPLFQEDGLIEGLQVLLFGLATLLLLLLWRRAKPDGEPRWPLAVVALLTFLILLEEISWGQRIIGFRTPESLRPFNRQGEFNFHNSAALQQFRHGFLLLYALLGIIALGLRGPLARKLPALRPVLPSAATLPWFLLIGAGALLMPTGLLTFDAEELGLPPHACGRMVSESLELMLAGSWFALCLGGWRRG
ncbi:MAG: hypothetical protein ACYTF3_06290 [Planctomycetota bacterium]